MTDTIVARNERLVAQLWGKGRDDTKHAPTSAVWAILDGARDPRVFEMVRYSGMERACLYAGPLPDELTRAAPHLIRLSQATQFTSDLLAAAWGKSWGIFFSTSAGLDRLRTHFRTFLRVQDEEGRKMVFRYYDPRVFREYLPTCNADELDAVFGPVDSFLLEGHDGRTMTRFRRDGAALARETTQSS